VTASLHRIGAGSQAGLYYTNDAAREARPDRRDEYYSRSGDGVWWSSGESVVRHGAPIDVASFRDLCAGKDPRTGKALVRGAGEGHWAGLDVTFTPGKSVSILWMAGTVEQREKIEKAHQSAVSRALQFILDEKLISVRQGAGGAEHGSPSDLIVARFTHFTTREGDPNIHSHNVIMNVAGAPTDRSYDRYATQHLTIEPRKLFQWQLALGAAYRSALAEKLSVEGLQPRPAGRGQWEIAGLPQQLIDLFSKRSRQIEEKVGRGASASQKEIAALQTRNAKETVPTGKELEQRWRTELASTGIAPWEAVLQPAHQAIENNRTRDAEREIFDPPEIAGQGPVAVAASGLFRHESVIERRRLMEAGLVEAALQQQGPEAVYKGLAKLEASGDLLRLSADCWTTPAIAACEAAMLRAAHRPQEREWFEQDVLAATIGQAEHLSSEQREAVLQAARTDGVTVIEAGAGTGKTTLARVIVDAARASGLKVIGLAPSWIAADELSKSTRIESAAISRWRYDYERAASAQLDAATVILVDEAGMVGTRDMSAILTAAHEKGAKVVLMGDRRQLASVPGASALHAVSDVVQQVAILDSVRRQTVDWQKAASILMARGDAEAGLRAYAANGRLDLIDGEKAAMERVISIWSEQRARHGDDVLIVTRRNADCAALNSIAREALKAEKRIHGDDVSAPALDREDKPVNLSLAPGDKIRFGENLPHLGIRNGSRGAIEKIDITSAQDLRISIKLEDGRLIEDDWKNFARERLGKKILPPRIVHSYAGTVYAAQGRTVAESVVYLRTSTDSRELYVGLTRHRHDARVVVERGRLDALCRQGQTDHRISPTKAAIRERLFDEARQYREKANVVDYCADRAAFARTGDIELPPNAKSRLERTIFATRALRAGIFNFDPTRIIMPVWRVIQRTKDASRTLPGRLSIIIHQSHDKIYGSRSRQTHDRTRDL